MTRTISNNDDIIDSRDVIERIEELEAELEDVDTPGNEDALAAWHDSNKGAELEALRALAEKASGCADDWQYGEALIRDSYFETYAQELADDIDPKAEGWPFTCINWEKAARELQVDYTAVEFDGVTYWIR